LSRQAFLAVENRGGDSRNSFRGKLKAVKCRHGRTLACHRTGDATKRYPRPIKGILVAITVMN